SATIKAPDGTTLHIYENTLFRLTTTGTFTLEQGRVEIDGVPPNGAFLSSGTAFTAQDGAIRLRFIDGSEVAIASNSSFTVPQVQQVYAQLAAVPGSATYIGRKRQYITRRDSAVHLAPGEIIHPLEVSKIRWNAGQPGQQDLVLSKDVMLTVPDSFAAGMNIDTREGFVEIIRNENATQPVAAGMALLFGDKIKVNTGSIAIHYAKGGNSTAYANENYVLNKTSGIDSPSFTLDIDPAFYFAKVYSFDSEGRRSTASEKVLFAPQVCGDRNPPLANAGKAKFQVAVGKTLQIDAGKSYDAEGKVVGYWLVEANANPNAERAPNNNPILTVGPFNEVGQRNMKLIVEDEAGSVGYQDITIDVITPQIVLEAPPLRSNVIAGYVEPSEGNVPITIARLRPGEGSEGWQILKTPSADADGQYHTNTDGKFRV
ncbi:MAG: hypothetical protein AAB606_03685, partial [Patescibacteria group bacterium]